MWGFNFVYLSHTKLFCDPMASEIVPTCLNWIAILLVKSSFVLQNSMYALEQRRMRIVENNIKGMGH